MKNKIKIIGEAGINHNGSLIEAKKLVYHGKKSGLDYVKFQLFDTNEFINKNFVHKKINYRKVFERFKSLEFTIPEWKKIIAFGKKHKIKIFFSIFDISSLDKLKRLKINLVKIPSGEITNFPLLREINKLRLPTILSTGMSTIKEIESAIKILKNCELELMHCKSEYPTNDPNLNIIQLLKTKFKKPVGYSDHTNDIITPALSIIAGAQSIEKHFTLNKRKKLGDHKFSLLPNELKKMVILIKQSQKSLGVGNKKKLSSKEIKLKFFARKGIYAKENLPKNHIIRLKDIAILRPEGTMKVKDIYRILNRKLKKSIKKYEPFNNSIF